MLGTQCLPSFQPVALLANPDKNYHAIDGFGQYGRDGEPYDNETPLGHLDWLIENKGMTFAWAMAHLIAEYRPTRERIQFWTICYDHGTPHDHLMTHSLPAFWSYFRL